MLFTRKLVSFMVAASFFGALAAMVDCGSATSCLRYSDCDDGYTCASGLCVIAPVETDGGDDDGGGSEVSSVDDASSTTVTRDAGSGAVTFDSSTSATADADADADASDSAAVSDASTD